MGFESNLDALLKTLCPRVFPDVAPEKTAKPYVTWQGLGGKSLRMLSNAPANKRQQLMQVSVWADKRLEALTLARSVEDAMCASPDFIATPEGEPMAVLESDPRLYGEVQRFVVIADR